MAQQEAAQQLRDRQTRLKDEGKVITRRLQ